MHCTTGGMPEVDPGTAGFCAERLTRIERVFDAEVRRGAIPGAVILVARRGKRVYSGAFGYRDAAAGAAMTDDCLFRLASMTKPVVSVAALMLVEEGQLQLPDPVSAYLPELGGRQVATASAAGSSGGERLRSAAGEITIQDLMRHTSGFTYGEFGASPLHQAYERADLMSPDQTNAELVTKLARLPLTHEPGTTFEYGMSTDVLGRVIEVVSGVGLDQYIAERISRPLGLRSLTFQLTEADAPRLARALPGAGPDEAALCRLNATLGAQRWISGGGGLCGNATDYLRFAQLLLNGGELDGIRLLSPKTVALMTSDALPPGAGCGQNTGWLASMAPTAAMGQGFGLGVVIRTVPGRNPLPGSLGDFSWAGRWGTYFWADPVERLVCVLLMQAPAQRTRYRALARTLVYQALETTEADSSRSGRPHPLAVGDTGK